MMSFFIRPLTLNQRLDLMAPNYRFRPVFGQLHRVMAIIEAAAMSDPPRTTPYQLDLASENVANALNELTKNCEETNTTQPLT
jgi:hypothetical protein